MQVHTVQHILNITTLELFVVAFVAFGRKRLPSHCIFAAVLINEPTLALVFMPIGVGISLAHDYAVWLLTHTLVH